MDRDSLIEASEFNRGAVLWLAIIGLLIVAPFAINDFLQGRIFLGADSTVILLVVAYTAWGILRDRYSSLPALLVLVPAIIFYLVLSLHRQGVIGALWCFPAVLSFYIILPERGAWIANLLLLIVVVPQSWLLLPHALALRVGASLLAVSTFSAIFIHAISDQQKNLSIVAATDALTGLLNRTRLDVALEQAIRQASRSNSAMSLVAIDIDHFKSINDTFGHHTGDEVLKDIGNLLHERLRGSDTVFRLGGEEFLALLFDTGVDSACQVAEMLRNTIEAHQFPRRCRITASIGVATLAPNETAEDWMRRADRHLYEAKDMGRNRVIASLPAAVTSPG